jgi:hypothetical protein
MNILRPIQKEFYGDDSRWFMGTVINANPPAGLEGRVKVRIHGVHNPSTDQIPEADLPWAQVLIPTTEGGSSGIGRIPQIVTGAFVFGVFLDGVSSQLPLVLGSLPRVEYPSNIQKSKRISGNNTINYEEQRLQNIVIERLKEDSASQPSVSLRRQQSLKFFIDNGYTLLHAAAITGALEGSSNFKTYDQDNTKPKLGIANWVNSRETGSRYNELLRFASKYQPSSDWKLFSVQLQFVLFELRNRFNNTNRKLIASSNLGDASEIMNRYYLNGFNQTEDLAQLAYDGELV